MHGLSPFNQAKYCLKRSHIAWNNHLFPPTGGFLPLSSHSAHPLVRILYSFLLSYLNIECWPHPSSLKGIGMTEPIKLPGDFPPAAGVRFEGGNPASNCRPRLSPRLFLSFVSQYQPQKTLAFAVGHAKRLRLSLRARLWERSNLSPAGRLLRKASIRNDISYQIRSLFIHPLFVSTISGEDHLRPGSHNYL
jgi:hypothetical protein